MNRVLHVDLRRKTVDVVQVEETTLRSFIGGRGLGGWFLAERIALPWNDPDMPILIFTGPLVGTTAPTSGRSSIMSRSPLTGLASDSSVGGRLGTELKRAGWDGIFITGVADSLSGIEISDRRVSIRNAGALAGLETTEVLGRFPTNCSVAVVGPAAENGVRFANIVVDRHHAAGRTGLGANLAIKNLKYLLVRGTGKVPVADRGSLKEAREEIFRLTAASPILMGRHGFSDFGTAALYDLISSRRMMPTDNFRATFFPNASKLNAHALRKKLNPRKHGCRGCHIFCKKITPEGVALPEFETLSHFTALIGNEDLDLVVRANDLCNRLGMDTVSAAATLACHKEITGESLSPSRVLSLLSDIGHGVGIGKKLGKGSKVYARERGVPLASITVKGMELPAYDPRGAYGMALAYAVAGRGGCHLRAYPISHEILRKPVATDRFTFSGKARIIKIAEDQNAVADSLTACKFTFLAATLEEYAKAFTAVTGVPSSAQELLRCGERICYHERMMSFRLGFGKDDDDLPARFFEEPGSSGNRIEIPPLARDDFLEARANYYRIRGLDPEGRPIREQAERLGLQWNA